MLVRKDGQSQLHELIFFFLFIASGLIFFFYFLDRAGTIKVSRIIHFAGEIAFFTAIPLVIISNLYMTLVKRIIIVLGYFLFMGSTLGPMFLDIPNAIEHQYKFIEGRPRNIEVYKSRLSDYQHFSINNADFRYDIGYLKPMLEKKIYRIIYLPESKYVIEVVQLD